MGNRGRRRTSGNPGGHGRHGAHGAGGQPRLLGRAGPAPAKGPGAVPAPAPATGPGVGPDPATGTGPPGRPGEDGDGRLGTTLRGRREGRADRRRAARRIQRRRRRSVLREIPILAVVALLIALVLKTFLVQAFVIPSGSMEQTIQIDDRVLVDKLTPWFGSEPERGDVVVFRDPGGWLEAEDAPAEDGPPVVNGFKRLLITIGLLPSDKNEDLIKRVIGVGGDSVRCCDDTGRVTVNGTPIVEPYLYPGNPPSRLRFEVTVPEGRYFVMGDHRDNSADSRYHLEDPGQGTVPGDLVVGRAIVIAWPYHHWRRLGEPGTYTAVPDPRGVTASARAVGDRGDVKDNRMAQLPSPAELPLVMGVVGLHRLWYGHQRSSKRSGCGGCDGRRKVR